jgi:hypothetical protein
MRLLFDRPNHFQKRLHLAVRDAARHGLLEIGEETVDARRGATPLRGRRDDERAAVLLADHARDQAALDEPIQDARQRRALVRQAAVELRDGRRRRGCEQRENVGFALREAVVTPIGEVETDPVRRAVNRRNEAERH